MNLTVRLLAPAALALAAVPGLAAPKTLEEAVLGSVFDICPAALNGGLSFNDASAIGRFGLEAAPDAVEAKMIDPHFGKAEMVGGKAGEADFGITHFGGKLCQVFMRGPGIDRAADAVEARLAATGSGYAPDPENARAPDGGTATAYRKPAGAGTAAVVQVLRAKVDGQHAVAVMTTIVPD